MTPQSGHQHRKIRSGNQMIAEGAIRSGCNFFSGYPITPASGIFKSMIEGLPKRGDIALSAPDEISALAYCVGASARGCKAMTATSGPGFALMIETLQYAIITEIPLVLVLVQRLGPSTGGATQGGQGDVLLAEFCTSGGYTIPIFAPSTAAECYELTMLAFSWSEVLRTPVIILSDKEVGMTSESVDYMALRDIEVVNRTGLQALPSNYSAMERHIPTYDFSKLEEVPKFFTVGGEYKVTMTGSAHDKNGILQKNSPETIEVLRHLQEKIVNRTFDMSVVKFDAQENAETLVISYGITARTAREAVRRARLQGRKLSLLNVLSLFPLPEKKIAHALNGVKRVIVAEENLTGLYHGVINHLFANRTVIGVNTIGRMITPDDILRAISQDSPAGDGGA
ncbi:MAG: transketolase C-terminal domain-containing protein [Bacteroidota bacterium]